MTCLSTLIIRNGWTCSRFLFISALFPPLLFMSPSYILPDAHPLLRPATCSCEADCSSHHISSPLLPCYVIAAHVRSSHGTDTLLISWHRHVGFSSLLFSSLLVSSHLFSSLLFSSLLFSSHLFSSLLLSSLLFSSPLFSPLLFSSLR